MPKLCNFCLSFVFWDLILLCHHHHFYLNGSFAGDAFSTLTLLVGRQEGHPAYNKTEWCGTGMVICLEWGANDLHMVQPMPPSPIISYSSKIQNGLPFWCRLTEVVLEKRRLNGCSSSFQVNLPGLAGPAESLTYTSFCLEDDVIIAMPANSVLINFTVNIVSVRAHTDTCPHTIF